MLSATQLGRMCWQAALSRNRLTPALEVSAFRLTPHNHDYKLGSVIFVIKQGWGSYWFPIEKFGVRLRNTNNNMESTYRWYDRKPDNIKLAKIILSVDPQLHHRIISDDENDS